MALALAMTLALAHHRSPDRVPYQFEDPTHWTARSLQVTSN
jgi:hypothetical protein